LYQQRLKVYGYRPPAGEKVNLAGVEPAGPNRLSLLEEEFPNGFTYHVGNLMGSLNHIGVGGTFYNGFKGPEMTRAWGTVALGLENVGPIVTRGVLIDIVGFKASRGETSALFTVGSGAPVLRE